MEQQVACQSRASGDCRVTGFTIPLAHGRGLFFGPVGLLPFQEPINVVVGAPISVQHYSGSCCVLNLEVTVPVQQLCMPRSYKSA